MCGHFQDGVLLENARQQLSLEELVDEGKKDNSQIKVDEENFQRILSHLSQIARHRPYNLASQTFEGTMEVRNLYK